MKDILKANRIAQYFEKNPKSNPIQMTLPVLFNYFSNLLICLLFKGSIGIRIDDRTWFTGNLSSKGLSFGDEKLSSDESF